MGPVPGGPGRLDVPWARLFGSAAAVLARAGRVAARSRPTCPAVTTYPSPRRAPNDIVATTRRTQRPGCHNDVVTAPPSRTPRARSLRNSHTHVVVSGPPGSGKTTLAHAIASAVGCPAICRDEIKEGMVRPGQSCPGQSAAPRPRRPRPGRSARPDRVHADLPERTVARGRHHRRLPARRRPDRGLRQRLDRIGLPPRETRGLAPLESVIS